MNITMKSKIMLANTCTPCDGTGKIAGDACAGCNGEGVTYTWTTLEDVFLFVNNALYKRMRMRYDSQSM